MKRVFLFLIKYVILFLFIFFYPFQLSLADFTHKETIKLAIINSYDYDHVCTAPQIAGIIKTLRTLDNYEFDTQVYYMKARKVYISNIDRKYISNKIKNDIEKFEPDYIITTDDIAFEYVGIPMSKSYKILFSGLNKPFKEYNIKNRNNFTGVEEKIILDKFIKILDEVKFSPFKIWIIKDNSTTGYFMAKNYIQEFKNKTNYKIQEVQINTIRELRTLIDDIQKEPKGVIVLSYQYLLDEDYNKIRPKDCTIQDLIKYNKKHLELGGNFLYSKEGVAISIAPNFYKMGELVSQLLIDNIKNGWSSSIKYPVNFLAINNLRLKEIGFNNIYEKTINIVDQSYNAY